MCNDFVSSSWSGGVSILIPNWKSIFKKTSIFNHQIQRQNSWYCLWDWQLAYILVVSRGKENTSKTLNTTVSNPECTKTNNWQLRAVMSKLFHKGPCGCRFLFQPVKSTQFDQSTFWRLRSVEKWVRSGVLLLGWKENLQPNQPFIV